MLVVITADDCDRIYLLGIGTASFLAGGWSGHSSHVLLSLHLLHTSPCLISDMILSVAPKKGSYCFHYVLARAWTHYAIATTPVYFVILPSLSKLMYARRFLWPTAHSVYLWEKKEGRLSLRDKTREALLSIRGLRAGEARTKLAKTAGKRKRSRAVAPKKRKRA
jgi:hypothetical protein